jgi:hypothetical protein
MSDADMVRTPLPQRYSKGLRNGRVKKKEEKKRKK